MLKTYIRRLNTNLAVLTDYLPELIEITHVVKEQSSNNQKTKVIIPQKNKPQLFESTGNICQKCLGSGWINCNKKVSELDYLTNFKFTICSNCNGTGFIP
tara:strand:- start:6337 stop:6636 length:300 start_codon:yes stop_codon:yes gene_type:complete